MAKSVCTSVYLSVTLMSHALTVQDIEIIKICFAAYDCVKEMHCLERAKIGPIIHYISETVQDKDIRY